MLRNITWFCRGDITQVWVSLYEYDFVVYNVPLCLLCSWTFIIKYFIDIFRFRARNLRRRPRVPLNGVTYRVQSPSHLVEIHEKFEIITITTTKPLVPRVPFPHFSVGKYTKMYSCCTGVGKGNICEKRRVPTNVTTLEACVADKVNRLRCMLGVTS